MKNNNTFFKNLLVIFLSFSLAFFLVLYIHSYKIYAQTGLNTMDGQAAISENSEAFDVKIEDDLNNKPVSILDQTRFNLKLKIQLTKNEKDKDFNIAKVDWIFPDGSIESFGGKEDQDSKKGTRFNLEKTNQCNESLGLELTNTNKLIETCLAEINPEILFSINSSTLNPSKFFMLTEKEVPIRAKLTINDTTPETISYEQDSNEISVRLKPPFYMIFLGGIIGALLVNAFLFLNELRKDTPDMPRLRWKKIGLQFLYNCIVMIIIIIFSLTGEDIPFLSLKIKDFSGGIIIGLFSFPLGDWLQSKLSVLPSESPKQ